MNRRTVIEILERVAAAALSAFTAAVVVAGRFDWNAGGIAALAAAVESFRATVATLKPGTITPASFVKDVPNG